MNPAFFAELEQRNVYKVAVACGSRMAGCPDRGEGFSVLQNSRLVRSADSSFGFSVAILARESLFDAACGFFAGFLKRTAAFLLALTTSIPRYTATPR